MRTRKSYFFFTYMMIKILGWFGSILLISMFALNSLSVISTQSLWYPALNLVGALCIGIKVYKHKDYSTFILQLFWAGIALFGISTFLNS